MPGRSPSSRKRRTSARRGSKAKPPGATTRFLAFGVAIGATALVVIGTTIGLAAAGAPVLGFARSLGSAGSTTAGAAAVSCPAAGPVTIGTIVVPAGPIAGYCQDRLINAAHIINAAKAQGIGVHTQAIGVMTAMGESSLVNVDHGDAVGPDSRGLFQQRDNGAWGTYSDRMTPYVAATHFFDKLVRIPGWQALSPTEAAHEVQVNADPNHYASYWPAAVSVVSALNPAG